MRIAEDVRPVMGHDGIGTSAAGRLVAMYAALVAGIRAHVPIPGLDSSVDHRRSHI